MIRKINHHLKERGILGTTTRFIKCWEENGFSYTIRQIFKPIPNTKIPSSLNDPTSAEQTDNTVTTVNIQELNQSPQRLRPRATALREYSFDSLEKILELRRNECRGVFVQAPVIDWEVPLFQRPQHMAIAMAANNYLVFYISNNVYDVVDGFIEVYPNLFVTNRTDLPFVLENALVSVYSTSSAYLPADIERIRKKNKVIYEYIDHIDPQISGDATHFLQNQFNYINQDTVDIVAISGKALIHDFSSKVAENQIAYIPNGVEFEHYQSMISKPLLSTPEIIAPITSKNKPIVGYFGALAPWLWYDLINEVTECLPDFEFVFIGPDYYGGVERLPKRDNVHYLGTIDYKSLPNIARYFDIAIIPFSPGPIAKTTSPLKLFEYFALQKPVVVTSEMMECTAFSQVLHGKNSENFIQKIHEAIGLSKDRFFKEQLLQLAKDNAWNKRALNLIEKIETINHA